MVWRDGEASVVGALPGVRERGCEEPDEKAVGRNCQGRSDGSGNDMPEVRAHVEHDNPHRTVGVDAMYQLKSGEAGETG